jgi:hypothetical protein
MRSGIASRNLVCALLASSALAVALACTPVAADADFTDATLLSGTSLLQFEEAGAPAISEDGRYVVFQGSLAGVPGIYRRDLQDGQIAMVAGAFAMTPGASAAERALNAPDARAPSVSADGRYVAFTSTADLDPIAEPAADAGCPEVYVRDMEREPVEAGAYTLASALTGTGEGIKGITFAGCPSGGGAQAAPGVAISADGQHVAFTVLSPSDLDGACTETPSLTCTTPPSQVAVRDLEAQTTTLVTATPAGEPTPGGGAYPSAEMETHPGADRSGSTAAISADASTVAWLGSDVPVQMPSEQGQGPKLTMPAGGEAEPLWRRIADGPAAFTRRLLSGAGINLAFPNYKEGAFVLGGSLIDFDNALPSSFDDLALSADGQTVAIISNAPPPASEASAQLEAPIHTPNTDAYVVHINDNPAAAAQVTALTTTPDYVPALAPTTGDVEDIAISPDGSRVAFDTRRTQFALPSLTLISPPSTYTGMSETYEANLQTGTLQRVTSTYDGAEPNDSAGTLALSGDGQQLAFASQASNLFYGDALPRTSEVYLAEEVTAPEHAAAQEIGAAPALAVPGPEWLLSATATAKPDGSVAIHVQVPGAGRLAAQATAQLSALAVSRAARARRGRASGSRDGRARMALKLLSRTVANAGALSTGPGEIDLRIRVGAAYHALLAGRGGLYAVIRITFAAPGHPTLTAEIPATFHLTIGSNSGHRSAAGTKDARGKAGRHARGKHGVAR